MPVYLSLTYPAYPKNEEVEDAHLHSFPFLVLMIALNWSLHLCLHSFLHYTDLY